MSGLSLTASENVSDVKNRLAPEHPGSRRMSDYRSFLLSLRIGFIWQHVSDVLESLKQDEPQQDPHY